MLDFMTQGDGNILGIRATGKLSDLDSNMSSRFRSNRCGPAAGGGEAVNPCRSGTVQSRALQRWATARRSSTLRHARCTHAPVAREQATVDAFGLV